MGQDNQNNIPVVPKKTMRTLSKRRKERAQRREKAQDFTGVTLTPDGFHTFYNKFINLRFPVKIAHVLELRYLINHAVDRYTEPTPTPTYRQFRESLQSALESFAIDNRRHSERMLKALTMFRDIHYAHSINSRNAERQLREDMERNRTEHAHSIRNGLFFIFASVCFIVVWLASTEAHWIVKSLPVVYSVLSWHYFHRLPKLDADYAKLTQEVNDVLRRRISSLNWKTLIHKLALVLGYKRVVGVEVFDVDQEPVTQTSYH